mgnify:CR=1 FL=1
MNRIKLFLIFSLLANQLSAQELEHSFEVTFKGKSIGNLFAQEKRTETAVIKDLRTNTEVDMIAVSVHVESEVKLLKKGEKTSSKYKLQACQ